MLDTANRRNTMIDSAGIHPMSRPRCRLNHTWPPYGDNQSHDLPLGCAAQLGILEFLPFASASRQLCGGIAVDILLSIDKIAKQSGVTASALRYYERCGLINEGLKIGGRRHYPPSLLRRLSVIRVCQKIGFSLIEIAELLDGTAAQDGSWRQIAKARRAQVQAQIEQLRGLRDLLDGALDCSCSHLEECPQMRPDSHLALQPPPPAQRLSDQRSRMIGSRL
jgi:MerR family redox-sensitive transcriptional activator SoxR